jgi:hypothetical protein
MAKDFINDPDHRRARADEMRKLAGATEDRDQRNLLLRVADDYHRIAQRLQERQPSNSPAVPRGNEVYLDSLIALAECALAALLIDVRVPLQPARDLSRDRNASSRSRSSRCSNCAQRSKYAASLRLDSTDMLRTR